MSNSPKILSHPRHVLRLETADGGEVCLASQGDLIATGAYEDVVIWDTTTGTPLHVFSVKEEGILMLVFSPDGRTLAIAYDEACAAFIDVSSGKPRFRTSKKSNRIAFTRDGQLAAATAGRDVVLWDVEEGKEVHTFKGHTTRTEFVDITPDGKLMATSAMGQVWLWDLSTRKCLHVLEEQKGRVYSLRFSPDGVWLATAGQRGPVRLWHLGSGEYRELTGFTEPSWSVTFSPDARQVAAGSIDATAKVWDTASGRMHSVLPHNDLVASVAFSPCGTMLAYRVSG
jgi:WD40 repeat protein